ncbi:vitamin B12 transporter BtuB [mine drainage metagenome]|uniref:Vitamin B12 transporter BtuB n=1 Tax=mine drainage metagenome TaxID=410659 RepID=A0A1J5QP98_9ZZZZ
MSNKSRQEFRLKTLAVLVAGVCAAPQWALAENRAEALETGTVEVVSTTPLPGIGTPIDQVPANVQVASHQTIAEQHSLDIAELLDSNLGSVTTNNTVANPFQADVYYRGFAASPLLGTPQGLSVFMDGVRVNEPFGDIVNWDLIPPNAIASISLIPGSNPLFGLNTLGGALSVNTKSGADFPGASATVTGGSWGRRAFEFEAGGADAARGLDYFVAGNLFKEDGWRDHSASNVKQLFSKVGWQNETSDLDLSVMLADTNMEGTQALPLSMMGNPKQAYTWPDSISNQLAMITLKGSHFLADDKLIAGNLYFRHNHADGFNSNLNNNFNDTNPVSASNPMASNAITATDTDGFGGTLQMTLLGDLAGHKNQFTGGVSADFGRTDFSSDTQIADVVGAQTVSSLPITTPQTVRLKADNDYYGLFATDTFSFTDKLHMTLSGRYNLALVQLAGSSLDTTDSTLLPGDLNGNHTYSRFNPAIGFNYNPDKSLGFYGGYNEGMRAPTPVELSCADPAHPCALPNAFGSDPNLQAVVSHTWEGGVRGHWGDNMGWNAGLFSTENSNDIQFIASSASGSGYFQNVGTTLRQGLELGLHGKLDKFSFAANYGFTDATFQTPFTASSSANSSADPATGNIQVNKGNTIPGVPQQTFKLRLDYQITPAWTVGSNIVSASGQYPRGDENNQDVNGKVPGYTVVHLDTHYDVNDNWKLFAIVNNIFDKNYSTFGILGQNEFTGPGNSFVTSSASWNNEQFRSPAAPRAAWVGVTYVFDKPRGGAASAARTDLD